MERRVAGKDQNFVKKAKLIIDLVLDSNVADTVVVGTFSAAERIGSLFSRNKPQTK